MQLLQQHLTTLKLSGIRDALEQQANTPTVYQELSFNERLLMLLEHELNGRKTRRIERLVRQAKFRLHATVEQIDYRESRKLKTKDIRAITEGEWLRQKQNIIITGATGSGKTYLACAIGHHFCQQNKTVFYYRLKHLLEDMYLAHAQGLYKKLLHKLTHCHILIIDDWGLEPLNAGQRSDLLDLIDRRYEFASTIIASQLPTEHWYDVIGESTHADAILDRIIHHSSILKLEGESMRKTQHPLTDGDQLD